MAMFTPGNLMRECADDKDFRPRVQPFLLEAVEAVEKLDDFEAGTTDADIDLFFGWNERVLLKAMQIHYATMAIRERMKHAKITGML